MTVNMKRTARRQTVNHFIHTFMKDYDTEKAADRTMKSRYVPNNLKTQLVSAMAQCDAADRKRIERVARLGMFIDSSCNELVYYNTVTTAVMRWTVSLYVDSADVRKIFDIVMEDAGRICDDDIHFIMEKYHYLEESDRTEERDSGEGSIMGFLKSKKHSPDTSLIRYYGNCLWLKILRAMLRNSLNIFNTDSLSSMFTGLGDTDNGRDNQQPPDDASRGLDEEARALYHEFRESRAEWLKALTKSNRTKIENSMATESYVATTSSENETCDETPAYNRTRPKINRESRTQLPRQPPKVSITAFDVPFEEDDYGDDDDNDNNRSILIDQSYNDRSDSESSVNESDASSADTVLRAPHTYKSKHLEHRPREQKEDY